MARIQLSIMETLRTCRISTFIKKKKKKSFASCVECPEQILEAPPQKAAAAVRPLTSQTIKVIGEAGTNP